MKKAIALILLPLLSMMLLTGAKSLTIRPAVRIMAPPSVYFKKNSLEYNNNYGRTTAQQAMETLKETLKHDSTIASVEIAGNADSGETNPVLLSQQRAEKVKADLVKLGIAPERLVAKGYGITRLLVKADVIKKEPKAAEKERMRASNRRCTYAILSWNDK